MVYVKVVILGVYESKKFNGKITSPTICFQENAVSEVASVYLVFQKLFVKS